MLATRFGYITIRQVKNGLKVQLSVKLVQFCRNENVLMKYMRNTLMNYVFI